ncbi:hypothetical protein BD769DRAFT_1668676 [Suillus cothurnatus]|nr:hypothetical protein BD769DRAFT_1668676 [Suillus cothurnatus]
MAGSSNFADFSTAIDSGIDNLHKWYHKINETDVYFICLMLDPNYKIAYAKSRWEPHDFKKGMRRLQIIFDKYYHHESLPDTEPAVVAPSSLACQGSYGHRWMHDTVKSCVANDTASQRPCREFKDYLASPLEDIENVVAW